MSGRRLRQHLRLGDPDLESELEDLDVLWNIYVYSKVALRESHVNHSVAAVLQVCLLRLNGQFKLAACGSGSWTTLFALNIVKPY